MPVLRNCARTLKTVLKLPLLLMQTGPNEKKKLSPQIQSTIKTVIEINGNSGFWTPQVSILYHINLLVLFLLKVQNQEASV